MVKMIAGSSKDLLLQAVTHGDTAILKAVAKDLNKHNLRLLLLQPLVHGDCLVHVAILNRQAIAFEFLLHHGAHPMQENARHQTALTLAVKKGYIEVVELCHRYYSYSVLSEELWPKSVINCFDAKTTESILKVQDDFKIAILSNQMSKAEQLDQMTMFELMLQRTNANNQTLIEVAMDYCQTEMFLWLLNHQVNYQSLIGREYNLLMVLVARGDLALLQTFKDIIGVEAFYQEMHYVNSKGFSALHWAVNNKQPEIMRWLLQQQVDCKDKFEKQYVFLLIVIARTGDCNLYKIVLAHLETGLFDKLVNQVDIVLQQAAIHEAVEFQQNSILAWLLKNGANPLLKDGFGRTILMLAATRKYPDLLETIYQSLDRAVYNQLVQQTNAKNLPVLYYAIKSNDQTILKWLLAHEVNLSAPFATRPNVFFYAVEEGRLDTIIFLQQNIKAEIFDQYIRYTTEHDNRSVLIAAIHTYQVHIVQWLLQYNNKKLLTDNDEQHMLAAMTVNFRNDCTKMLETLWLNLDRSLFSRLFLIAQNNPEHSILSQAIAHGGKKLTCWLLQHGADCTSKSNSLVQQAIKSGNTHIVKELIEIGAPIVPPTQLGFIENRTYDLFLDAEKTLAGNDVFLITALLKKKFSLDRYQTLFAHWWLQRFINLNQPIFWEAFCQTEYGLAECFKVLWRNQLSCPEEIQEFCRNNHQQTLAVLPSLFVSPSLVKFLKLLKILNNAQKRANSPFSLLEERVIEDKILTYLCPDLHRKQRPKHDSSWQFLRDILKKNSSSRIEKMIEVSRLSVGDEPVVEEPRSQFSQLFNSLRAKMRLSGPVAF